MMIVTFASMLVGVYVKLFMYNYYVYLLNRTQYLKTVKLGRISYLKPLFTENHKVGTFYVYRDRTIHIDTESVTFHFTYTV